MKKLKSMINGEWQKVNGKFILSVGHFAYDGCHKIYLLEKRDDVEKALHCGYYLIPVMFLREYYEKSCPLKFVKNWDGSKIYVGQGRDAEWSSVKATKTEIEKYIKEY